MSPLEIARFLGEHPTELALTASLVLSLLFTLTVRLVEKARPWLRLGIERGPSFFRERGAALYKRFDEPLVLVAMGLLGVLGGISLFMQLAEGVLESRGLHDWDTAFVQSVHRTVAPGELVFFRSITPLAGVYPPLILGLLVAIALGYRRHYSLMAVWIVGLVGNAFLSEALKRAFMRQRPTFDQPFLVESNFSFPSGHSMTSILLYGLLAYVLSREVFQYDARHRLIMVWSLTFLGVLIGTSRLVLGVHYPSDVMGGWSVAIAWLSLLIITAEGLRGRFRLPPPPVESLS